MFGASPDAYRAEINHRRERIGTSILGPRTWRRVSGAGARPGRREGPVTGLGTGSGNGASY